QVRDDALGHVGEIRRTLAQVSAQLLELFGELVERGVDGELARRTLVDLAVHELFERRVFGHHGLRLEHILCRATRALAALVQLGGNGRDRGSDSGLLFFRRTRRRGRGGCLKSRRHDGDGALSDTRTDAGAADLGGHDQASWSVSSMAASWSSTPSALSPSTVRVTESPVLAPSEMTPRMLAALTALPSPLAIVTVAPESLAAALKSFAGRACRPCELATVTVRVAMVC